MANHLFEFTYFATYLRNSITIKVVFVIYLHHACIFSSQISFQISYIFVHFTWGVCAKYYSAYFTWSCCSTGAIPWFTSCRWGSKYVVHFGFWVWYPHAGSVGLISSTESASLVAWSCMIAGALKANYPPSAQQDVSKTADSLTTGKRLSARTVSAFTTKHEFLLVWNMSQVHFVWLRSLLSWHRSNMHKALNCQWLKPCCIHEWWFGWVVICCVSTNQHIQMEYPLTTLHFISKLKKLRLVRWISQKQMRISQYWTCYTHAQQSIHAWNCWKTKQVRPMQQSFCQCNGRFVRRPSCRAHSLKHYA